MNACYKSIPSPHRPRPVAVPPPVDALPHRAGEPEPQRLGRRGEVAEVDPCGQALLQFGDVRQRQGGDEQEAEAEGPDRGGQRPEQGKHGSTCWNSNFIFLLGKGDCTCAYCLNSFGFGAANVRTAS